MGPSHAGEHARAPLVGVLVGGHGRRMGGVAKSELRAPPAGERLIERQLHVVREAGLPVAVVGTHEAMAALPGGIPHFADAPEGVGPLGGLRALLRRAGDGCAIALACDMPFVTAALLGRLAHATGEGMVIAPRDPATGKWQPFFARYDAPRVLPVLDRALADRVRSFQALFQRLDVAELPLDDAERALLRDWDTPEDVTR